jgi:DNA mismatch repair protein MutL
VHDLVCSAVAEALERSERRLWDRPGPKEKETDAGGGVSEPHAVYEPAAGRESRVPPPSSAQQPPEGARAPGPQSRFTARPFERPPRLPGATAQQDLWTARGFADLTLIGQFRGTYIICQDGEDLILIDQHAAHERVVYEELGQRSGTAESQQLLLPETVELSFSEAGELEQLFSGLAGMGLEIDAFGGTTFAVKSVPTVLSDYDAGQLVRGIAERSAEIGLAAGLDRILDACRMIMACHRAVRANQRLDPVQIRRLLTRLDGCRNPSHCPHGRPTWIRWTLRDLEKAFGRA